MGSDGGGVRVNGKYVDRTDQCTARKLAGDDLTLCRQLLRAIPKRIDSLNDGLRTLQYQSVSLNPASPRDDLLAGTQDNGTWAFDPTGDPLKSCSTLPGRFVSSIAVDPADANHAWVSYSGYDAYTPSTPGHVFELRRNPDTGVVTATPLSFDLGDQPITDLVRDDQTSDLYAATDFGVLQLAAGASTWRKAAEGLPVVAVYGLTVSPGSRVLYAATHGRGVFRVNLPGGQSPAPQAPTPGPGTPAMSGGSAAGPSAGPTPGSAPRSGSRPRMPAAAGPGSPACA